MAFIPLLPVPLQLQDAVTSVNMSGGSLEFYLAGTSTPTNLFSDDAGTSIGTFITLNSGGFPESGGNVINLFYDTDIAIDITAKDSANSQITTVGPIKSPALWLTQDQIGSSLYPQTAAELAAGVTPVDYSYPPGDVRRNGALLDNTTDDFRAFQDCGNANTEVYVPPVGTARIATTVVYTTPIHMHGGGTIRPDIGGGGGKLFAFETSDVLVENMIFDGTGSTGTLSANHYILFGGDGTTKFYRHTYRNLHIHDVFLSDGLSQSSNLLVTHSLYVDNVDRVTIEYNHFNTVSGSGVFTRDITGLTVHGNRFIDCQWYNCTLDSDVRQFSIRNNYFDCQLTTGVYYGGMVNLMSLHTAGRNQDGVVDNNYFTGNMSYGVVIRCLSITGLEVSNNTIENWDFGTWALSDDLSAIRVETRGVDTANQNGPCHNVSIFNNKMTNPDTLEEHRAIYCGNQFQASRNPSTNIRVYDNEIISASTLLYFSEGIIFHGFSGGFESVRVYDNDVTVFGQTTPVVGGCIGFVASDSGGAVDKIFFGRNNLVGLGTPSGSQEVGYSIGAFATNVYSTEPSYIDNFFYGIRTLTSSGPTLDGLDNQAFVTNTTDSLFNVTLSRYESHIFGSATWDPSSIASGSELAVNVTVTGAALGDFIESVSFSLDVQDLQLTAEVTTANQATAQLTNNTGGAIDLGSGTVRVRVSKAGSGE